MTNIILGATETPTTHRSVTIVTRGPRISPRDAYTADHIVVGSRNVYFRRIESRVFPRISVHGARP